MYYNVHSLQTLTVSRALRYTSYPNYFSLRNVYASNTQRLASESLCDSTQVTHSLRSGTQTEVSRPTVQGHSQQHCELRPQAASHGSAHSQLYSQASFVFPCICNGYKTKAGLKTVVIPQSSKRGRIGCKWYHLSSWPPNLAFSACSGEGGRWLDSPNSAHGTQS